MKLQDLIKTPTDAGTDGICHPKRYRPEQAEDREAMEALFAEGQVSRCHDTLHDQLGELLRSRSPERIWTETDLKQAIDKHLDSRPAWRTGNWFHFPWSGHLVHLLPEDEFAELRCDRNRYKITREEQATLGQFHIGVVGLSVGQASAICLAMEGVGGQLRLADFDTLGLSNLNRLRAGVHELGLSKTVLAARSIYEINPYADLKLYHQGIQEADLDDFLLQPRPLDLLIEECDDLAIKVLLRQRARQLGIPVLMDTCDRGLIDIERFDLEPERPLFHGLAGELSPESLRGLSTSDKVPYVLRILGENQISKRTLATLVEVDQTVSSWPQLASGVALGAALVCDVSRRLLLGKLECSGRFYVDLNSLIGPGQEFKLPEHKPLEEDAAPEALQDKATAPALSHQRKVDPSVMRDLLAHGILAMSGGNCQPWKFIAQGPKLICLQDSERSELFLDFAYSASQLAMGSVIENLDLAAARMGLKAECELFPAKADPTHIATMRFQSGATNHPMPELVDQIQARVTNRRLGERAPLAVEARRDMDRAAKTAGAELCWIEDEEDLDEMGHILGMGDRLRFLSKPMHAEMMAEVRWNRELVEATRDGIDIVTLELPAADRAAMRVAANWSAMKMVEHIGGGRALEKISRKAVAAASAIGLLRISGTDARSYVQGGRAIQRVWLAATAHELAFQPMTAINYVWARMDRGASEGLNDKEQKKFRTIRQRYASILPAKPNMAEIMLFRVACAPPPTARSLRRSVDDVIAFSPKND